MSLYPYFLEILLAKQVVSDNMKETIDKYIDDLVDGEETVLGSKTDSLTVHEVLIQEFQNIFHQLS